MATSRVADTKKCTVREPVNAELVEYIVVVVPDVEAATKVATALADLARSETLRVLDAVVVTRGRDDAVEVHEVGEAASLAALEGLTDAQDGWLGDHDIALASLALPLGTTAVVLVAEDRWAAPLSAVVQRAGGQILGERVPAGRVQTVLREIAQETGS
jgi:hypothetical protein